MWKDIWTQCYDSLNRYFSGRDYLMLNFVGFDNIAWNHINNEA